MRRTPKTLLLCALAALAACCAPAETREAAVPEPADAAGGWYLGAAGGMLLPGCGNSLRRAAEVSVRAGRYVDDFLAFELEGACAPNACSRDGNGALSGVAVRGLYHLAGIDFYDNLFGCERFDPFVAFGAATRFGPRHAFADGSHRASTGPVAGVGAFYHLTEHLDLRVDGQAMLGVDSPCGMLFSVVAGLQWNFGGGDD